MLAIEEFEREVKKGLPRLLYFLFSGEPFFLSESNKLLRENLQSLLIESYENPEEILKETELSLGSLFSPRRIITVYNFEKIKKTERRVELLQRVLKSGARDVTVVFLCNGSSRDFTEEISFLRNQKEASVFNLDISEREIPNWIQYKAEKAQIKLKADAVNYLLSITGGQPGLIASEIEKIAILLPGKTLGLFDIKEILTELGEFDAFDLVDALRKKDRKRAFELIEKLKNTEPDMILGALNYYYSNFLEAEREIFRTLYRANLELRQGKLCILELLLYDLFRKSN